MWALGTTFFFIGLAIAIPGLVMFFASPPSLGSVKYGWQLCPRAQTPDDAVWHSSPSTCSEAMPGNQSQIIPLPSSRFESEYPYTVKLEVTDRVYGVVSFEVVFRGQVIASSGELDLETLDGAIDYSNTELLLDTIPFEVCGGEIVLVSRRYPEDVDGYFPEGVTDCNDSEVGCYYAPIRSIVKYSTEVSFTLDETPTLPGELFIRGLNAELLNNRDSAPEMYCVMSVGKSSSQETGFILLLVGAIIADLSPGIAYWWLARKGGHSD